jgi:hypothetical protein
MQRFVVLLPWLARAAAFACLAFVLIWPLSGLWMALEGFGFPAGAKLWLEAMNLADPTSVAAYVAQLIPAIGLLIFAKWSEGRLRAADPKRPS